MNRIRLDWIKSQSFWLYALLSYPFIDYLFRNIFSIPIVSSLWDDGLILLLLLFVLFRTNPAHRPFPQISKPLLAFYIMGLAYLIVDMNQLALSIEGFRAVFQYMLAFFIGYYLLVDKEDARKYLMYMVLLGTLIGLYGMMQKFMGVQTPQSWIDAGENISFRAFSIVQSPNILGSYMILLIPITFSFILMDKSLPRKLLWGLAAFIMAGALYLTLSRGAWLALIASFAVTGALYNRKILAIGLIVGVLALTFVPSINHRFSQIFSQTYIEKAAKDGRIARWMGAYDKVRYEPFFGSGLGHYGGAVAKRNLGTTYVDSYYFKTLAETGLVGLGIFLWLLSSLFRHVYSIWKGFKEREHFLLMAGMFTGLVAVIFHNGVENIFEVPFMSVFFWFIAGMALSYPFLLSCKGGPSHE